MLNLTEKFQKYSCLAAWFYIILPSKFLEVDGSSKGAKEGVWGHPTETKLRFYGDGFPMDRLFNVN